MSEANRFIHIMDRFFPPETQRIHESFVKSMICDLYDAFMKLSAQNKRHELYRIHGVLLENDPFTCRSDCVRLGAIADDCSLITHAVRQRYFDVTTDEHPETPTQPALSFSLGFSMACPPDDELDSEKHFIDSLAHEVARCCRSLCDSCIIRAFSPHDLTFFIVYAYSVEDDSFSLQFRFVSGNT